MYSRYVIVALAFGGPFASTTDALTRQEAIHRALQANPEVAAGKKAWDAARARLTQARAIPDPELELEYEEMPGMTRFGDFGERAFGATQQIESPLKWRRRSTAARQAAEAVRMGAYEMTRLDISTRVKVAYDGVLFGSKKLDYTREDQRLAQDFLRKAQLRLEAGDVAQLEVLRAEVEAGRAANRVTDAINELAVSRAELNTLLASERGTGLEIEGDLEYQAVEFELELLQQTAIEHHPDVLGSEWVLQSAQSERALANAAFVPDVTVGLFRQTVQDPAGKDDFWRVGLSLEFPLWAAARQRGQLAEATASVGQAEAELAVIQNRVLFEVERAFLHLQTSAAQVRLYKSRIIHEAERTFEVASQSYAEGKVTYLERLEAQRTLTAVRQEYAEALFNHRVAVADLEKAVGKELMTDGLEN